MSVHASCSECRWKDYQVLDDDELTLMCRRYPPQVIADGYGDAVQVWPQMNSNDWCGEFEEQD